MRSGPEISGRTWNAVLDLRRVWPTYPIHLYNSIHSYTVLPGQSNQDIHMFTAWSMFNFFASPQRLVNVLIIHITQLLGISSPRNIWRWGPKSPKRDVYQPLYTETHLLCTRPWFCATIAISEMVTCSSWSNHIQPLQSDGAAHMLVPSGLATIPQQTCPKVPVEKWAIENGHRNSEFSIQHADFPWKTVKRLPEGELSFTVNTAFYRDLKFMANCHVHSFAV